MEQTGLSNIKLTISYDGTGYYGWQTAREGPSIEKTLQQRLESLLQHKVTLQAASRTDKGVHAEEQIVNFFTTSPIPLERLHYALNSLLPKDIAVQKIEKAEPDFHPSLDSKGKEYHYFICTDRQALPFNQNYAWYYPYPLCVDTMKKASSYLIGKNDFSSLTNRCMDPPSDYVREIHKIEVLTPHPHQIHIIIRGNRFLYKMARNIVGTLVSCGSQKIPLDSLPTLLAKQDRTRAGITAPAKGLILKKIFYCNEDH